MKLKNGFSLMEMMVVLLIISIIAAGAAPMIHKNLQEKSVEVSNDCGWIPLANGIGSIFNSQAKDKIAMIGRKIDITADNYSSLPFLYVFANANKPHIQLQRGDTSAYLTVNKNSFWFSSNIPTDKEMNSIAIGQKTTSSANSITIGTGSQVSGNQAVQIGSVTETGENSIALGFNAKATGRQSITIGSMAKSLKQNSIAIGYQAENNFENSIAIGNFVSTTAKNQIVLGTAEDTVYIPGNIVIDGNSIISRKDTKHALYKVFDEDAEEFTGLMHLNVKKTNGSNEKKIKSGGDYKGAKGLHSVWDGTWDTSDRRLKNVGEAFKGGLEEIKKLEVFNYAYKKDTAKTPRVGVMAQDLQKIFPNAVFKGDDGFLRIRMEDMFYALVNAVKELDNKIDLLVEKQKEIDTLREEVKNIKKDYADLAKRLEKIEKRK